MVERLDVKQLARRLVQPGPYLYFYNADSFGGNGINAKYINSKAITHPIVKVFEINWADQFRYNPSISIEIMKNVYLYFRGEKKFEIANPTIQDIDILFYKCVEFHNEKMEQRANNVGIRSKQIPIYNQNGQKINTKKELSRRDRVIMKCRKNYFLKRIIAPLEEDPSLILKSKPFVREKKQQELRILAPRKEIKKRKRVTSSVKRFEESQPQWFQDVNLKDLPMNFLDEEKESKDEIVKIEQNKIIKPLKRIKLPDEEFLSQLPQKVEIKSDINNNKQLITDYGLQHNNKLTQKNIIDKLKIVIIPRKSFHYSPNLEVSTYKPPNL